MSDVFLSYSRKDTKFVQEVFELLSARKREAWIDLHGIEYSAKWWEEICGGIDGADNFILFVSPNSLESLFCHREIQHALKHNKRIIPFLIEQIDQQALFKAWQSSPDLSKFEQLAHENWESIQAIQWIDFTKIQDANKAVDALLETVDTDPERVKLHTRLLLRLRDWESRGQNPSGLLRGDELAHYEQWFSDSQQKVTPPHPTDEQVAYIAESRRVQDESEAKRIQRERLVRRFRNASAVLGVFFLLAVVAIVLTIGVANNAVAAQQTSVAKEGQANTQVAVSGVTLQAGSTLIADGHKQIAVIGQTLTVFPPKLTMVAQTIVAGSYMIESLRLSADANAILRTEGGNAETAALLSIRVLRKIYLASADSALVAATSRLMPAPQVFKYETGTTIVAFSPDGKTFLSATYSGSNTGYAELRDTASGNVIWKRSAQLPAINSIAFSPDGKLIVAAGSDHTAMVWEAASGNTVRVLQGHDDVVQAAVFSPDGKNILTRSVGSDLTLRLWEVETGKQIYSVPASGGGSTLFYFPDGQTFYDGNGLYRASDGQVIQDNSLGGGALAVSADGRTYVKGMSPTAELWNNDNGQKLFALSGHTDAVMFAAFSSDGRWLVTGGRDNTARVWDVVSGKQVMLLSGHTGWITSVAFSPDGTQVLTGSADGTTRLWTITADNEQQTILAPERITTSAVSPDGKTILTGDVSGGTNLWDLSSGKLLRNFTNNGPDIKAVAFSPDGKLMAVPDFDPNNGVFKVYDPTSGALLKTFSAASSQPFIGTLAFSADSKMIFAMYFDGSARLWDVDSGQVLRLFSGNEPGNYGPTAYSPDGKLVVMNGGKFWWDIPAGAAVQFPDMIKGNKIVFSDDGSLVATTGPDLFATVWNVATKQEVNRFSGHTDQVVSMAFSPDNKLLLTGSSDNSARLWDIASGQLIRVFSGHSAAVTSVAFSPDGKKIITTSLDRTIRTWFTDYNDLLAYACTRVGVDLTMQERTLYGVSDQDPVCPQFATPPQPLLQTTTPMPTRTPPQPWTPMPTPTQGTPSP